MLPAKKIISALLAAYMFGVCVAHADTMPATESAPAATPDAVPAGITDIYSDVDMRVRLAAKENAAPCVAEACRLNQAFDARVQQLGAQLSTSAFVIYPALKKHMAEFSFSVVDKKEPGTASNGAGKVVLFRGLQDLPLSDDALSYVMAREMGHVIGKHHVTNTSTKLIISALAAVLFPAVAIVGASSAAAQATTATTLMTSAASTATSLVGSEVALAKMKPEQLAESDAIALNLMQYQNWDLRSAASVLQFDEDLNAANLHNGWMQDLQVSHGRLQKVVEEEDLALLPLEEDANLIAELAETPEQDTTAKTGQTFEDVDLNADASAAESSFPPPETMPEQPDSAGVEANADVKLEPLR